MRVLPWLARLNMYRINSVSMHQARKCREVHFRTIVAASWHRPAQCAMTRSRIRVLRLLGVEVSNSEPDTRA
jgi:uracil-DNA glycosylase